MSYDTLRYDVTDKMVEITLDRPDLHNPLDEDGALELRQALEEAAETPDVTTVLLTGTGTTFSAGGDISEFTEYREQSAHEIFSNGEATADLFKALYHYPMPLVTAVNGHTLGGGVGLAASAPIVVASEPATFGTTEISLGLFPLVVLPALRRAVGDRKTLELALTAQRLDAREAADIGLVSEVVPEGESRTRGREIALAVADRSPLATALGLRAFRETTEMPAPNAIDVLNAYRVMFYQSQDLKEGAEAFLEDRSPEWEGR